MIEVKAWGEMIAASGSRGAVLQRLAIICASIDPGHPLRVAIDGIDAAGKTHLADELVAPITSRGRNVIRASIGRFHNPRRVRYKQGRDSPEGYYLDSFNLKALVDSLLRPLGPGGGRQEYRLAVFDVTKDSAVDEAPRQASVNSILLFDGVFLLRPELLPHGSENLS
jgi:uridine kinase